MTSLHQTKARKPPTINEFAISREEGGCHALRYSMVSERKRIAAQFRSEGEGRSAEILGTMEKELRQIRSTAYRRVQEIQGQADADATRIYGNAYNRNPEFYAFLRTLESYKIKTNMNSVLILTTDSDFYRYVKQAIPGEVQSQPALVSTRKTP